MIGQTIINELGNTWEFDTGFFGKLRQGIYDENLFCLIIKLLKSISIEEDELIPKEMVTLLWMIPLFMEWQKERINKVISLEIYATKRTEIENELIRILGTP